MSNEDENLQIKDVYDCACDIFQEFEKIVELTGIDDASTLITKVKNVLLLLEESVKKIENIDKEYSALKTKCMLLSNDKQTKDEEIKNLKQSFEELEESWSKESLTLKSLISKLKIENKVLKERLEEKEDIPIDIGYTFEAVVKDQENLISRLKSNLKHKEDILEEKQVTVDALKAEIIHLKSVNQSLHARYQEANKIIIDFQRERNESEERIKLQEQKMHCLREAFEEVKKSITEKIEFGFQNIVDVYKPLYETRSVNEEIFMAFSQEQLELKQKILDMKLELVLLQGQLDEYKRELNNPVDVFNSEEARGQLDQIFQLFLELLGLNSGFHRGKRMYSA